MNIEETFSDIYKRNRWGGNNREFYSGSGTMDDKIVGPYILKIEELAISERFFGRTFIDLGCGDFQVGKKIIPLCSKYIGIDIVKPLIRYNQNQYGNDVNSFKHLNIIDDELPDGDVCFVRQVLQHLSNSHIMTILEKVRKYQWVFLTEHYPTDNDAIIPNIDKFRGPDIRLHKNSGVYFTFPPYELPHNKIELILEVMSNKISKLEKDQGIIRTFLYKPNCQS